MEENQIILEKDNPTRWLIRMLKGVAVGIGAILPGLSGGVLAVIFNIYDPLLKFLGNIKKNFMANVRYFIPIGIGGVLGVVVFSVFVEKAFGQYAAQFTCLFIGFVAGTFPSLFRTAGKEGRNGGDWLTLIVSAIFILLIMMMGSAKLTQIQPSFLAWIFSGAMVGLGMIVPGMSPSNFLIYFGLYDKMAAGISAFDFSVTIPLAIGLMACVLLFAKLVNWLFGRYYSKMYHFILGMVVGSSIAIFPTTVFPSLTTAGLAESGLTLTTAILFSVIMFALGTVFSLWFSKIEDKYSRD
ncbi:DUF368 domain-containing protein [Jeotgalibaca sp. PTS2502]|uniref:DUF368 domain-containing protein n=1 Tax=Jeotgalibaca sp. PTS2502 TaxID=1903686 RepID=UPI0009736940|nr:DUF368 domain-containing protein [Jeotgalibaca sp. PTS2502]APZ49770.1 DUF368 domain-containing protein [Jeotgalibaca sp. PTS2502]